MPKKEKNSIKKAVQDVGNFKTKDTLREEDVKLTSQVSDLERRYKDLYKHVHQLSVTYQTCKEHFALQRYGDLKSMIKACITDEVMDCAAKYSAVQEAEATGKAVSLMKAAKQLSIGAAEVSARDEVSGLHKAEIVQDIEEKEKRKDKLELKFLRLHNRLTKLRRDYEDSKVHNPMTRYKELKEMIKPLIRDETLKV